MPILNLVGFVLLNASIIYLIFRYRPYKSRVQMYRDVIVESGFGMIHFLTLFLFSAGSNRNAIGLGIVCCCWTILAVHAACIVYEMVVSIRDLFTKKNSA